MKNIIDATHANSHLVQRVSNRLYALANAASLMGHERLGDELAALADDISESAKSVNSAVGIDLSDYVQRADQATSNMLTASLLACVRMNPRDKEERI